MKRNDPEHVGLFHGDEGLWAAVLLDILSEIETVELQKKIIRRLKIRGMV